jgi:hypothetical protein
MAATAISTSSATVGCVVNASRVPSGEIEG